MKLKTLALAGVGALALSAAAIGTASAEPSGTPQFRALSGVGSDTTQDALNGLSEVVVDATGTKLVGSYNATGGGNVKTKAAGCDFARPNGSGAGRNALLASLAPGSATAGCLDFSRSSSLNLAPTPAGQGLTYIPFGIDALTFAITSGSSIPRDLTTAELTAIYRCEVPGVNPLLPQSGSGSRQSWLQQLGLTETTKGACVRDVNNGTPVQEHDGRALTGTTDIVPFSVSQFLAQTFGAQTDRRGRATLGVIDGKPPLLLNTQAAGTREVYNVVPTAKLGTSPSSDVFVGPSSRVCAATTTIQRFGFGLNPNCGSTTQQTPTS
ncbi:MAG: hypothetical protein H7323_00255 [Frankiales bacterium]|nr:hypothetical protein [Frankiales bacterium]